MSPTMIPPSLHPPPPPPGYPVSDGGRVSGDVSTPGRTQSRGDGFWRGWSFVSILVCGPSDSRVNLSFLPLP
nr:cysteine-rich and transmembrane domain-containing protein A-like [Ipomoea batatas]